MPLVLIFPKSEVSGLAIRSHSLYIYSPLRLLHDVYHIFGLAYRLIVHIKDDESVLDAGILDLARAD